MSAISKTAGGGTGGVSAVELAAAKTDTITALSAAGDANKDAVLAAIAPKATPADVTTAVNAAFAAQPAPGAVPGEVRLFALGAGEPVPTGWTVDASRQLDPATLPTVPLVLGLGHEATGAPRAIAQIGNETFQFVTASSFRRYRALDWTTSAPETTYAYGSIAQGYAPALVPLNGNLLCLGGRASSAGAINLVYEYNITSKTYIVCANLPAQLSHVGAVALDSNRVLVVGGGASGVSLPAGPVATLYVYTRSTDTWQTLASVLETAASGVRVARLPSGNIMVLGGVDAAGAGVAKFYIFDTATLTLGPARALPTLPSPLWDMWCLRTPRGMAYRSGQQALTEYDEATDTFAAYPVSFHLYTMTSPGEVTSAAGHMYGNDLEAGPHGHVLMPGYSATASARHFVISNSGVMPAYRYLKKL